MFLHFVCFWVLFLYKSVYNKICVTFLCSSITISLLFFVSDIASSSGKRTSTRPRPFTEEDFQNFLDILDNDDEDDDDVDVSALADTYIQDGNSDDDHEDTETNFVIIVDNDVGTIINSSDSNEDETTNDDKVSKLLTIIIQ